MTEKSVTIGVLMDILKKLTEKIEKYYALVENHETQIQDWIKEIRKPLHSITNQSAILRAASPENSVIGTPFENFAGFRESLLENILVSLQKELIYLEEIRDKIDSSNGVLLREQQLIETLFTDLKIKNPKYQVQLNPCCPSLKLIVTWCCDIWCYYHSYYLQIAQSLFNLNLEDDRAVKTLVQSFKENSEFKKHINKIRNFNFSDFEFLT